MSDPLRIAVVCPLPWPPSDEVTLRVAREADALARRGHRVSVMVPARDAEPSRASRGPLTPDDVLADPGTVRELVVGRAIRTTARRSVAGPIDLAVGLERALSTGAFDVVHVHEPLAPSPLLAALRHTDARTIATFHRLDPPAGVAFIGPLVERALDRLDARVATSAVVERTLNEVLPADYDVVPAGAENVRADAPTGHGVMVVARGKDRSGLRFGLTVARTLGAGEVDPLVVLGPREAAWRTRAAVPKALRPVATVLADDAPGEWMDALDTVEVVIAVGPEDLASTVVTEARGRGRAVVGPRTPEAREAVGDADDVVLAAPFNAGAWVEAVRDARGRGARQVPSARTWDDVAEELEDVYLRTLGRPARRDTGIVLVDPRVRPPAGSDLAPMAEAFTELGVDAVGVASAEGVAVAEAFQRAAPGVRVIPGREVTSQAGVVVGLFLTSDVPDGLPLDETLRAIRDQGGVTLVPHPESAAIPSGADLRAVDDLIDCRELSTGALGTPGLEAVRDARALGLAVCSSSGAADAGAVGSAGMVMGTFGDAREFLHALAEAEPVLPRRVRRARARERRRTRNT